MAPPTISPVRRIRLAKGDLVAMIILGAIPILIFGVAAVLGHPFAPGDDAIQNFPLRVLAGRQLASGHLPVFNPYTWGGSALLGGWNAGALYPFTFLFAILPPDGAWAVNEMIVYAVGALGLYAFLRALPLATVPSALGAATFAFSGALDVHLAHFGLVAGMSWIPFLLLALLKLSRPTTSVGRASWIGVLGVAGGMSVLAGEPRAIDTTVIVSGLYFLWLVTRLARRAGPFVLSVGGGVGLAVLLGAVQWLPGAMAVATSQRAKDTYFLFSSGSLNPRWLLLILVPSLLGGSGSFGTSSWFAGYNLPEVMGYVGLLPVVAAFGLLGRLRFRRPLPDWLVWQVMAVVGIALAIGSFSPLGPVLAALPLFGGQRLQSRNIAVTDLALAVLLAYWVDDLLRRRAAGAAPGRTRRLGVGGRVRILSLVPLIAAAALAAVALVNPTRMAVWLQVTGPKLAHALDQRPLFVVSLVLCLAAAALVVTVAKVAPRRRTWLLVGFVLVDLAFFNVADVFILAPGLGKTVAPASPVVATGASPTKLSPVPALGTTGRFVIYDPQGYAQNALHALSVPDLNVLNGTFSSQGYSAIVYGPYAEATGSHAANGKGSNALDPAAVSTGLLDQLDTTSLLTSPNYLVTRTNVDATTAPPPATGEAVVVGAQDVPSGGDVAWDFGETLDVTTVSLPWVDSDGASPSSASWRVGLEEPGGRTVWPKVAVTASPGRIQFQLPTASPAVGLVVAVADGTATVGPPVMETAPGSYFVADGPLASAVVAQWTFDGDKQGLAYFTNRHAVAPLTLRPLTGAALGPATVRARGGPALEPTAAAVDTPHGAELVRAVTDIPGWTATWTPSTGGAGRTLTVRRSGLVQAVDVPAGQGVVTWYYHAPGVIPGLILSVLGVVLLAALAGGTLYVVRRSRLRLRMARENVPNL
jgi:hypothetical protein